MDLKQLLYLKQWWRRTISAAAKKLNLSQPPLSHRSNSWNPSWVSR